MKVRLQNKLYRVKFSVAERLAIDAIIGTEFLNEHVLSIVYTQQRIRFRDVEVPIIKLLNAS